jgi:hypothetical protein
MPFWKKVKKAAKDRAANRQRLSRAPDTDTDTDSKNADIEEQRSPSVLEQPSHSNANAFSDLTPQQLEDFRKNFKKDFQQPKAEAEKFGLFILCDQPPNNPDAVDIVAIHGLNGHYINTWQSTSGRVLWLKDLLPDQIPQARIMSYGYDSSVAFSKSTEDISTFADDLLEMLMSRRRSEEKKRPLIFICHSLGGIVVKKVGTFQRKYAFGRI